KAGASALAQKATLTLAGATQESKEYDIYAAEAVVANSTIKVDGQSFIAGADITVTVTLKDKASNPLVGEDSATLKGFVTVHGATLKGDWLELEPDGTYQATYTATLAGTTHKAVLTLGSEHKDSATYTIAAGEPAAVKSTIELDKASYVAGANMVVTVELKDAYGNPVSGKVAALTTAAVNVSGAASQSVSWVEVEQDGTYQANYTATLAGTTHKATLTLGDGHKDSATYTIAASSAVAATSTITMGGG
ncbi:TPA: invasin domain 3-containing protein, partial [Serratia liquefaciens]